MKTAKQLQLLLEDAQEVEAHLPAGWAMARIGDLAATEPRSLTDGPFGSNLKTSHYTEAGPRVIRLQNIGDGEFVDARAHISPNHFEKLRQHEALAEDVLIAMLGEDLPRACLVPESLGPAIVKADCARLRVAAPSMSPAFVMYALNAPQTRKFASALIHGVGRPRLGLGLLRELPVPLAPTSEQIRLTEAVDSYLSRLDDAVATLERVQRNLKRYRASVLKAAVEGRLVPTEAELARKEGRDYEPADVLLTRILEERKVRWIEHEAEKGRAKAEVRATKTGKPWTKANDQAALAKAQSAATQKYKQPAPPDIESLPQLPEGWCWATLGQFLARIEAGRNFKCIERPPNGDEVGVVKVSAVTWGTFDEDESKTCPSEEVVNPAYFIREGDLLFSRANTVELVGACVITGSFNRRLMLSDKILRLVTVAELDSWLLTLLRSDLGRRQIEAFATGNQESMRNISQASIRRVCIPVPPLSEANRIISKIATRLSITDQTEVLVEQNLLRTRHLRRSILKWAFEGKLVDQDPNDEPASVLLGRIKAERQAAEAAAKAKKKQGLKKGKKKSA